MRIVRRLKGWFFKDFMTMTVRGLVLSEVALIFWALVVWSPVPTGVAAGVTCAAWVVLGRIQPRLTLYLRRAHFRHPLVRLGVQVYFAACLACMVGLLALVATFIPYALGWPIAHWVSTGTALWWSDAFRAFSTAGVLGVAGLIAYGGTIGQAIVRHPHSRVPVPHLPSALRGLRIVHISDLHLGNHLHGAQLERYVARVNAQAPDILVITGDIVDHAPAWIDREFPTLARLQARYGVYVVLGNHDGYTGADAVAAGFAAHTDFTVLRDAWTPLTVGDGTLYIIGLDDPSTHFGQWAIHEFPLNKVIADLPTDGPALLLSHRPDVWPRAVAAGIPLTLAGHTHGGQIGVPGSRRLCLASLITKFQSGWYEENGCHLYVSRGLGVAGSPIRIGAPREIAIHELEPAPHHAPVLEGALAPAEAPADS